ncbi:MAG: hypothetical protein VB050_17990 [Geobacteraceae bacterium]|nr:hypothetical protein [Geobacteraceae bacterium]
MNEIIIRLLKPNGEIVDIKVKHTKTPPWSIETSFPQLQVIEFKGADLFECLCNLRSELDKMGLKMLCNGSRIDAYPSRMSRDMGGARKVYLLRMGQQGRLEDLVELFDEAPADKIGTVEEQKAFYRKWLDSLGNEGT